MLRIATKFLPEPAAFQQAVDAGFRHAELYLNAAVLDAVDDVLAMARQFDLKFALHFPNRPELNEQHLKAVARLFDELSASAIVIHPPMLRLYGESMSAIHPGIILAEETMRVPVDEFLNWVRRHEHVTLDIEHIWKFSLHDSPLEQLFELVRSIFREFADRVRHVHMPGYLPGQGEHRPMYTSREFCMGIFDILADYDFDGLVVSETDVVFQNPLDLKMDMLLFERWKQLYEQSGNRPNLQQTDFCRTTAASTS